MCGWQAYGVRRHRARPSLLLVLLVLLLLVLLVLSLLVLLPHVHLIVPAACSGAGSG